MLFINVSRIIFGLTFMFSGFVKAIDPLGSAYKFNDYFSAFHLEFFQDWSVFLSVALAAVEFTTGFCVLAGCYRRISSIIGLLFMIVFTPLTLYLAIANPVSDCGCFGDAYVISNWETFYKNIVLLAMIIFINANIRQLKPFFHKIQWAPALYAIAFSTGISLFGLRNLPLIDFRPYKVGVNIDKEMQRPEGAPAPEHVLIYEKDGVKKQFTLDNYPANDESWKFVESKTIDADKKWQPKILDFFLTNQLGDDVTTEVLLNDNYSFLIISPDLDKCEKSSISAIRDIYSYAAKYDYNFYMVTSADDEKVEKWEEFSGLKPEVLYSDATLLKTIIRSNPGLIILKDGTIVRKFSHAMLPTSETLSAPMNELSIGRVQKIEPFITILYCFIIFFLPIILFLLIESILQRSITYAKKKDIHY